MALRLFRCPACDHHLRLGAHHCGRCREPAPARNRRGTLILLAVGLAGALLLAAFLTLS